MGLDTDFETVPLGTAERLEQLEDCLRGIRAWCKAYPLGMFPEPNWEEVTGLLQQGGIPLDRVSASLMRHVIKGVEIQITQALGDE